MRNITKLGILIGTILLAYHIKKLLEPPILPKIENTWWSSQDPTEEDTSILPFRINVSDEVLNDLKFRLKNAKLTPPLEEVQHQYGINAKLLNKIVDYWLTKYSWREREKFLNQFPQFTVNIQGLRLHYIHVKPSNPEKLKVFPILLLHGWPGSVREFYDLIPLLTKQTKKHDFVFEVILPSLPGYGFSEAAVRPGLGPIEVAIIFKNFMKRLGFEKYYIHGGDWGSLIAQQMAILFQQHILGIHSNLCFDTSPTSAVKMGLGSIYPSLVVSKNLEKKLYPLTTFLKDLLMDTGYMYMQVTKPDTLGLGLRDSPIGLCGYILEKFITWTNSDWKNLEDGGLTRKYTYDSLLDNVMIYWISGSITTSMRLYSQALNNIKMILELQKIPITVPSACAIFPNEIFPQPPGLLKEKYRNLVYASEHSDGGHFPALEVPDILAEDIFVAIQKMVIANFLKK